ncbi:MAG TPA: histidine phosphatase family protein [Candidatus Binataceae bacterium]|jgi:broad specificity phosphatase PhoE|nr:histidine phosphatase family protein [Candidatus Binataceae bacterium]
MKPAFTNGAGTLILVRHGETEGQSSIRYHGRGDVALDERGRAQMWAAAEVLKNEEFAKVFASPLCRATEGARIIAGENAAIAAIGDFVEIDFGDFEGLTIEEIRERYPDEFERWRAHRLEAGYQYPNGESGEAFRSRVRIGMERMFELWRGKHQEISGIALLVAHRGVIRLILNWLIGVTPAIELGSIHILDCDRGWRARILDLIPEREGTP